MRVTSIQKGLYAKLASVVVGSSTTVDAFRAW